MHFEHGWPDDMHSKEYLLERNKLLASQLSEKSKMIVTLRVLLGVAALAFFLK